MDFFHAQDDARQSTTRMVLLFAVAVLVLIIVTNVLIMFFMGAFSGYFGNDLVTGRYIDQVVNGADGSASIFSAAFWEAFIRAFNWKQFFGAGAAVIAIVALASLYKIMVLSSGGKAVAEMLGGRLISQNTEVPAERKVLNVVEEMSIASGTPVPPVYLLAENSINAFAAGYEVGDAVIGVTQGCIQHLNRDQLQGVIAHEFSHIINGDMRLNIRIVGMLHGILIIGLIGHYILRSNRYSSGRRGNSAGAALALGFGLMVIGYAGSFFGSLIKASVSRQREYLADASAVQFTRNPDGIADALKKIGGHKASSFLDNPEAPEMSHAYFANGVRSLLSSIFATHPPLEERIRRIEPSWDGLYLKRSPNKEQIMSDGAGKIATKKEPLIGAVVSSAVAGATGVIDQVGRPQPQHLIYAHDLLRKVPDEVLQAMREPYGARALIYSFVINKDAATREKQLEYLERHGDQGIAALTYKLVSDVGKLDSRFRLPLIDGSMAALRQLSPQQYQQFRRNLSALIKADNKIALFEWALQKIVFQYLDAEFVKHPIFSRSAKYSSLSQLKNEVNLLLSLLSHAEQEKGGHANKAFEAGAKLMPGLTLKLLPKSSIGLSALNNAIDRLSLLKPLKKPQVLKACAACITADKKVTVNETELFRAFSAALDCPMPPLILET